MVAHCDVSPVLELGKGVFDPVPRLVRFFVVFDSRLSVAASGNAWLDAPVFETVPDLVGVVAAIADEMLDPSISHVGQHLVADVVADIASGQVKGDGPPPLRPRTFVSWWSNRPCSFRWRVRYQLPPPSSPRCGGRP